MPKSSTRTDPDPTPPRSLTSHPAHGAIALVLGATGIGFAPLWIRSSELGPFSTAAYRLLFACPVFYLWRRWELKKAAAAEPVRHPKLEQRDRLWLVLAGLFFAGDMALWNWSLHLTSVANSTLITNLTPLLVMVGAWFLFRERVTRQYLLSLPLAFAGVYLLVRPASADAPSHWKGDFISGIAAFFYAGYLLSLRVIRQRHSTAGALYGAGVTSCIALFLIAWLAGEPLLPPTPGGWLPLLALGFISHVGGQGLIAYGFGHVTAAVGSLVLLVQPVVAAALAWWCLGESMGSLQLAGAVLVLIGIGVAVRRS